MALLVLYRRVYQPWTPELLWQEVRNSPYVSSSAGTAENIVSRTENDLNTYFLLFVLDQQGQVFNPALQT